MVRVPARPQKKNRVRCAIGPGPWNPAARSTLALAEIGWAPVAASWLLIVYPCLAQEWQLKLLAQRFEEMMNFWVPVVFGAFKLIVLGTFMFLAIKSHHDGEKAEKAKQKEMMARQESGGAA
ncbi:hypothetical protein [Bordetella hinzii]|uniref:hypothetical protein n=1 Tax=Bordetella hinzii TaxID=103855 RepID=UPI001154D64F|nr:hypothetical protein [Bordetella hinzii]